MKNPLKMPCNKPTCGPVKYLKSLYCSGFQPFCFRGTLRSHSSDSRSPCSYIFTRELKTTVNHSISATSGGTPIENHCLILYYIILYYSVSYNIKLFYTILYYFILYYVILYYIILYYIILYYILYYIVYTTKRKF